MYIMNHCINFFIVKHKTQKLCFSQKRTTTYLRIKVFVGIVFTILCFCYTESLVFDFVTGKIRLEGP